MNRTRNNTRGWIGTLCLSLALGSFAVFAAEASPALELARQLNQAFIEVADRVSVSVVVVRVAHKPELRDVTEGEEDEAPEGEKSPREFLKPPADPRGQPRRKAPSPLKPRRRDPDYDSQGSGVVIREDGYILTNRHVVDGAERIRVRFADGREYDAEVRGVDSRSDIAVLKVSATGLKVARLGDSAATRAGEFAVAIGAPFELDYSVTVGHVSAKGRSQVIDDPAADQDFIQTDANINPGNSGGPLVNLYGEVIGINTLIRGLHTGIGFAIPINLAREIADKLIAEGRFVRAWLGVGVRALREAPEFRALNPDLTEGLVVTEIRQDGPARNSDLKPGDVITAVDGKAVVNAQQLKTEIRTKRVGQMVGLEVHRRGKNLQVKLKTEAWEDDSIPEMNRSAAPAEDKAKTFGLGVQALTEPTARQFGVEKTAGVLVTEVEYDSVADRAGLRVGHILSELDHQPVTTDKQFREVLARCDLRKGVVVVFLTRDALRCEVLQETRD